MMRLHDMPMADGFLHQQAVERRHAVAKARAAAQREREREAGPPALPIPSWASKRQVAAARAAAADVAVRARATKVARGWDAVPLRHAPPGSVPVAMLIGKHVVAVAADASGCLRLVERAGRSLGSIVSVAEAAARAAGR